jgi:lipid A disaccharide synthetase
MREAGVELVADCSEVSLVGIVEIAKKYPALKRVWKRLSAKRRAASRASRSSPISRVSICAWRAP